MPDLSLSDFSRRRFLKNVAASAALLAVSDRRVVGEGIRPEPANASGERSTGPWFQHTLRWGQINLTEIEPARFDLTWWREHWKRTCLQGIVINGGGIVAYYPTKVPFHRRSQFLGNRDLFGEIRAAAKADGLRFFSRMDSNRTDESCYLAHPDWFTRNADGHPYKLGDLFIACVNGPYYDEHMPAILREIAIGYRPDGFADNNWNGLMRHQPCFCDNCQRKFHARSGREIPRQADWKSAVYRDWIIWNYERRLEIWTLFNRVTREAGGPECIWVGMMAGSTSWQSRVFRDDREIYRRTEMVMLDDQRRFDFEGFQHNGEVGKRIRAVGGWDKIIPESMAMYALSEHSFQLAAKPTPEVRMWVVEGFAGGVQPWWHHVGGDQQDHRMLHTAIPLWQWHRDNQEFLINRRPVATVGLLWSQRNTDFFGRDDAALYIDDPWNGFTQSLIRARISYVPVNIDDLEREAEELGLSLLVLPNLAALSDLQVESLRRFVGKGGNLVATGASSLCNEWGEVRSDLALGDLFGAHLPATHGFRDETKRDGWVKNWAQTYLRLIPEWRARTDGPRTGTEPPATGKRHEVLRGFDETDILAYGSQLEPLTLDAGVVVPLTFIPAIPNAPVEFAWMRQPKTDIPALVLRETSGGSRIAYLPADIDRRFSKENLPDHGDLLANIVRWAVKENVPLRIEGTGLIDGHLYQQSGRLVLHLINLTSAGTWRTPVQELIAVGPFKVAVKLSPDVAGKNVRRLVATNESVSSTSADGWIHFEIPRLLDHEVLVIS